MIKKKKKKKTLFSKNKFKKNTAEHIRSTRTLLVPI